MSMTTKWSCMVSSTLSVAGIELVPLTSSYTKQRDHRFRWDLIIVLIYESVN